MYNQKAFPLAYTVKTSSLVMFGLATAFFPRFIAAVGVPSVVNFIHFACISLIFGLTLPRIKTKLRIDISKVILLGLFSLLVLITASAYLNNAGLINIVIDFLLLAEPFMLLIAIIGIHMSSADVEKIRFWVMVFAFANLLLALVQYFVLGLRFNPDDIKGVFLNQGAGHHVGGAVSMTAAVYFFIDSKIRSMWIRILGTVAFMSQVYPLSDSKQVIAVFVASLVILSFTKFKSIAKALQYLTLTVVVVSTVLWVATNVLKLYWVKLDLIQSGFIQKFSVFSVFALSYHSPLNWLFGLGPGHTIGRLGLLLPDYYEYLQPLGATISPVTEAVQQAGEANWQSAVSGSSMWSLTFSWAGIWGDLGLLGLVAYLCLWVFVWYRLCLDDLSKFFVITILMFGAIFNWIEEPGYMLFVASILGMRWQEHQIKTENNLNLKLYNKEHFGV